MRATINRADNVVSVDGETHSVDCSALPGYVSVIQWDGDKGWIEFQQDGSGAFMPNTPIASIEPYRHLLDRWQEARAASAEAARKAREKQATIARLQDESQAIAAELNTYLTEAQKKLGAKPSAKDIAAANAGSAKIRARLEAANDRLKAAFEAS